MFRQLTLTVGSGILSPKCRSMLMCTENAAFNSAEAVASVSLTKNTNPFKYKGSHWQRDRF